MLNNCFSEKIFPNIQSKPPLTQLEVIASCPIATYLGKETNNHLATTSFRVVVETNEISPQCHLQTYSVGTQCPHPDH